MMAQSQSRGNSPVVTLLLFLAVFSFFFLQMAFNLKTRQDVAVSKIPEAADVAIVGGTAAALLTSLEAAENGAQVFLFPNGQELGEDASFLFQEGLAAALTPPQGELEIELTPELFGEYIGECGGWLSNPSLLESFKNASPVFYPQFKAFCGISLDYLPDPVLKPYLHLSSDLMGASVFKKQLLLHLNKSPVLVKREKVSEILFSPEGVLEALLVENSSGEIYPIYFKSVVLADGGYSGDLQRWHEHLPYKNMIILRPAQTGEGLKLAEKMGVDLAQMGFFGEKILLYNPIKAEYSVLPSEPWESTYFFNINGILLNWSEASWENIFDFITQSPPAGVYMLVAGDKVYKEKALAYNSFFTRFEDLELLAEATDLTEITFLSGMRLTPPYYIAHLKAGIDYTLGGILTTPFGEVKRDGKIIEGLYAAGEIVGGLHGKAMLPGMPLSETLFFAKKTGEAAAKYAQR
jgi:fumarate reductase flavoprotein subunit